MTTQTRQLTMPDVAKDRGKSVTMPQTRSHAPQIGQTGITIGREWKVSADQLNVILHRRVKSKTGKADHWEVHGYHSTLGSALVGLVRQGIRDTELADIQSVQDKIAQLEHDILKMAAGR
jgi:predicted phage tail protein